MQKKPPEQERKELCDALDALHADGTFRLAVCFPTGDRVHTRFAMSLANLSVMMAQKRVASYARQQLVYVNVQVSNLHQARQLLIERALVEARATHILFVDGDQTFPPDTIHRLAAHGKMVVAANIVQRKIPMVPCAVGFDGKRLWTRPDSTGLEKVFMVGTGVMLLNTKIFKSLSAPFFLQPFTEELGFVGEDTYFCEQLRKAQIPIWIDHDLSKEVGHLGEFEYNFPVAWEQGFSDIGMDWKEKAA